MEVNGEEERRSTREDDNNEVYYSLPNLSPCSAFHRFVQAILKCFCLESSSSSPESSSSSSSSEEEEDQGTEIVEETGFVMGMISRLRRRPRPPISSGRPGQIN